MNRIACAERDEFSYSTYENLSVAECHRQATYMAMPWFIFWAMRTLAASRYLTGKVTV